MELTKVTQLAWRKHLATDAGIQGILFLREGAPSVNKGPEHEIVFDAGKVEGYNMAIQKITEELINMRSISDADASND